MRIMVFTTLIACALIACDRTDSPISMDIPAANQSDDRGIFLSWRHPVSHRTAILEEMDGMVWLSLSQPQTTQPARDCPAFVTATPPDSVDWERIKHTGEPPGITKNGPKGTGLVFQYTSERAEGDEPPFSLFVLFLRTAPVAKVGLMARSDRTCAATPLDYFCPMTVDEIEKMSMTERLQVMERLWDAVCHESIEPDSPDWHQAELARRKARVESGEAEFLTIQEAKRRLQR